MEELLVEGNRYLDSDQIEGAIEQYKTALTLAQEAQDTYKIAASFSLLATAYTKQNQQKMAAEYYRQAAKLYRDVGETFLAVGNLYLLGEALTDLVQYEEALTSHLEAFAIGKNHFQLEKESERDIASKLMAEIAATSVLLGKAQTALSPLKEAVELFRRKDERKLTAEALNWLAKVYLKEPEKGLVFFAKELERSQVEKDRYLESEVTYHMGILLYEVKNSEKAFHFQERALKLCKETNNLRRAIDVLGEIGAHYGKRGQSDKALQHYSKALQVAQGLKSNFNAHERSDFLRSQGGILLLIGQIHDSQKQYEKAVEFYRRARECLVKAGARRDGIAALGVLNGAYSKLGRARETLLSLQQWQEEEKEQRMLEWQVKAFINLARVADTLGEIDNARKYFFEALAVCQNSQQAAPIIAELGRLAQDMSRYDEALNFYHQALGKYHAAKDPKGEGEILARIGEVYRWLGDNESALRWYRDALETRKAARDIAGTAQMLAKIVLIDASLGNEEVLREHVSEAEKAEKELRERISLAAQTSATQQIVVLDDILALTRLIQVGGEIAARWGQPDQAISMLNQALQVHQKLPRTREFLKETAIDFYFLGYAHSRLEQYDEALKALQTAGEIARQLYSPELYWVLNRTGFVHEQQGKLQEALALYIQATEILGVPPAGMLDVLHKRFLQQLLNWPHEGEALRELFPGRLRFSIS
ncbi:MAG: tetratricopeptide repeat protein, partial [Candidatus Binatia bacterium]